MPTATAQRNRHRAIFMVTFVSPWAVEILAIFCVARSTDVTLEPLSLSLFYLSPRIGPEIRCGTRVEPMEEVANIFSVMCNHSLTRGIE